MTRRLAALGCVLLLATAGCAGIGGSDDTTTETVSDTAETYTASEPPEQLAPGVTAAGVEDARALADAHRGALEGDQFVRRARTRMTNESATATQTQTQQFTTDSLWRLTVSGEQSPVAFGVTNGTYGVYADSERVLWRLVDDETGNTSYGVEQVTADGESVTIPPAQVFENQVRWIYNHGLVYSLAANADSAEAVDGTEAVVELSGTAPEAPTRFDRTGDVEFTMTVTGEGRVTAIDLTYASGDTTVERTITFDTDVVNPAEEPAWYETALNETGLSEAPTSETDA
jgi:hypothetical protein